MYLRVGYSQSAPVIVVEISQRQTLIESGYSPGPKLLRRRTSLLLYPCPRGACMDRVPGNSDCKIAIRSLEDWETENKHKGSYDSQSMVAIRVNIRGELPVSNKKGMRQYPSTERYEEVRQLRQKKQWSWPQDDSYFGASLTCMPKPNKPLPPQSR